MTLWKYFIRYLAIRKLERIARARRNSFECEQFRRRRAAALKGHQRRKGMA